MQTLETFCRNNTLAIIAYSFCKWNCQIWKGIDIRPLVFVIGNSGISSLPIRYVIKMENERTFKESLVYIFFKASLQTHKTVYINFLLNDFQMKLTQIQLLAKATTLFPEDIEFISVFEKYSEKFISSQTLLNA